jgi:hypothetical protein
MTEREREGRGKGDHTGWRMFLDPFTSKLLSSSTRQDKVGSREAEMMWWLCGKGKG